MTLHEILQAIWRRKSLVLAIGILSIVLGGILVLAQGRRYQAQAQVLLIPPQASASGLDAQAAQNTLILEAVTLARAATAPDFVLDAVAAKNATGGGVQGRPGAVGTASVTTEVPLNTTIIIITASGDSQQNVEGTAQAVADKLRTTISDFEGQIASAQRTRVSEIQHPSATRSSINPLFAVFSTVLAGLAIAVTIVLVLEGR
jgi:capsular polysaccharide biosynthesis protein